MAQLADLAFEYVVHTRNNVFLTGKAGTGKTTLLKRIVSESFKRCVVAAPTGVAAVNAGGITLHSLFSLHPFTFIPSNTPGVYGGNTKVENYASLNRSLRLNAAKINLLRSIELLIIDEVSMLRCDFLDAIDLVLRKARRSAQPFGGVQILFIGDLFQLPPIVKPDEEMLLKPYYSSFYFFESKALKDAGFKTIALNKVYRQHQPEFIELLNEIRSGNVTKKTEKLLLERFEAAQNEDIKKKEIITLTTHRNQSDNINNQKLHELKSQEYEFNAIVDGDFNEQSAPVEPLLKVKVGARVMFLKNDKYQRFYNGKTGTVTGFDDETQTIEVLPDGESENIQVSRETWQNKQYRIDDTNNEIKEQIKGSFQQYPLRLAWAVTIHKSQGLTFSAIKVDAAQVFESGQLYVALSRCTSIEGVYLINKVSDRFIPPPHEINQSELTSTNEQALNEQLKYEIFTFFKSLNQRAFQLKPLLVAVETLANQLFRKDRSIDIQEIVELKNEAEHVLNQYLPVNEAMIQRLETQTADEKVIVKLLNAVPWFVSKLNREIAVALNEATSKLDTKAEKEFKKEAWLDYLFELKEKSRLLVVSTLILQKLIGRLDGNVKSNLHKELEELVKFRPEKLEKSKSKAKVKGSSMNETIEVFERLKSIKLAAKERGLTESTIESHLAMAVEQGLIEPGRLMPSKELTAIHKAFEKEKLNSLKDYYAHFKAKYSYGKLRIAQAAFNKLKS